MDDLRRGAQSAGHCCRVYYSRGPAREGDFIRFGSAAEVALHGAASRLLDAHGLFSRRATRQLLQNLDAFKPTSFICTMRTAIILRAAVL